MVANFLKRKKKCRKIPGKILIGECQSETKIMGWMVISRTSVIDTKITIKVRHDLPLGTWFKVQFKYIDHTFILLLDTFPWRNYNCGQHQQWNLYIIYIECRAYSGIVSRPFDWQVRAEKERKITFALNRCAFNTSRKGKTDGGIKTRAEEMMIV